MVECARGYSLYDLFVYQFSDDIDFNTGDIEDDIIVFEGVDVIKEKLQTIHDKARAIDIVTFDLESSDENCDELLQEFYRVNEDLGGDGKWEGGAVSSVCRGFVSDT